MSICAEIIAPPDAPPRPRATPTPSTPRGAAAAAARRRGGARGGGPAGAARRTGRAPARRRGAAAPPRPRGWRVAAAAVLLAAGGGAGVPGVGRRRPPAPGAPPRGGGGGVVDRGGGRRPPRRHLRGQGGADLPVPPLAAGAVRFVRNDRWREGIATSLQAGVARARRDGHARGRGRAGGPAPGAGRTPGAGWPGRPARAGGGGDLSGRAGEPPCACRWCGPCCRRPATRGQGGDAAQARPGRGSTVSWSLRRHRYGGRSPRLELTR